jgi:hypothetical protein
LGGCGGFASKQENVFNNENRLLEVGDRFTFSNKKGEINEEHAIIQYNCLADDFLRRHFIENKNTG